MNRTILLLKALAEPTRLRIIALCRSGGDLAVSEFVRILGQSQPRVSRHLKLLTDAGALIRIPEGSWVFYRISAEGAVNSIVDALIADIPEDDITLSRDHERLIIVKKERAEAADTYFGENAAIWNEIRAMHIDQRDVNAALEHLVQDKPSRTFLDIGTGTGEMLLHFAKHIEQGEGIDASREMLAVARASLEAADAHHCHVRQGDLYSLPFDADTFDIILIHQVLHYVDDIKGAVIEAARVLRPGGTLLIADFAPHAAEELRTAHQHRRLGFADQDIEIELRAASLDLDQITHLAGDPLTVSIWAASKSDAAKSKDLTL